MNANLASSITKAASKQTYYTIRILVDRDRVDDAYRAYGYFRWVDDLLDSNPSNHDERKVFLERQKSLLESCYRGEPLREVSVQEQLLVDLIEHDQEKNSGLQIYLRNMMQVMEFDVYRRGRLILHSELNDYTRWLAVAVIECIHYFIGHKDYTPHDGARYLAVSAAHIVHMLRDTFDDAQLGYYNIPREILEGNNIGVLDIQSNAYRTWVKSRVQLARQYFKAGKDYFHRVQNVRCRLACFAYIARFDWLLGTFERDGYRLRPQYNERKSMGIGLRMIWQALSSAMKAREEETVPQRTTSQPG